MLNKITCLVRFVWLTKNSPEIKSNFHFCSCLHFLSPPHWGGERAKWQTKREYCTSRICIDKCFTISTNFLLRCDVKHRHMYIYQWFFMMGQCFGTEDGGFFSFRQKRGYDRFTRFAPKSKWWDFKNFFMHVLILYLQDILAEHELKPFLNRENIIITYIKGSNHR